MKEKGVVLHVAGSGRVIVRLTGKVTEGDVLCDERGRHVVRIREIIGPVRAPYASAQSLTNNIRRHLGMPLGTTGRQRQ